MDEFTPTVPVELQMRRIILERFNDTDARFTNDELFEALKSGGDIDPDWIIDDTEPLINGLCEAGLARSIAQNFTTIWLKLNGPVRQLRCKTCGTDVCVGEAEDACPNPSCGSAM